MIDPITISATFAIAKGAIAGVQEAIQMGKDLHECTGDLIKFFEHRDTVAQAAVKGQGITSLTSEHSWRGVAK